MLSLMLFAILGMAYPNPSSLSIEISLIFQDIPQNPSLCSVFPLTQPLGALSPSSAPLSTHFLPSCSSYRLTACILLCFLFALPKSVFPTNAQAAVCSFQWPISQRGAWHRLGAQSIFTAGITRN